MSDTTGFAELDGQQAELLPARTVLSLLSTVDLGTNGDVGTPGNPGIPGANGESLPGSGSNPLFLFGSQRS